MEKCSSDPYIDKPDRFLNYITDNEISNIIIGNGFCLSHPRLKEAFQWNLHQALCKSLGYILPSKSYDSPESDLEYIRKQVIIKILDYYMNNILTKLNEDDNIQNGCFLSGLYNEYNRKFGNSTQSILSKAMSNDNIINIFTLNYDPLLYFEILKNTSIVVDGFITPNQQSEFLKQEDIKRNLEIADKKSRILFVHGSWFIQSNENDELRKLQFSQKSKDSIADLFKDGKRPYLILEDRWRVKKALLEASDINPYLNYCYSQLKEIEGNLIIFGCSFNKDDHIVQAIADNLKKGHLKTVHICYLSPKDKDIIQEKFKSYNVDIKEWVLISENVMWKDVLPTKNFESSF